MGGGGVSAQRWYTLRHWTIGKGNKQDVPRPFPSKLHALAFAEARGWKPRTRDVFATRSHVYEIVEMEGG